MSISNVGATCNIAGLNSTITGFIDSSQDIMSVKSQSITIDSNRQMQDSRNQVKDDQDALSKETSESKKQKRREHRHKIFGWIFHPLRSVIALHANKTGKTKTHTVLMMLNPVKLVRTVMHPRKTINHIATKLSESKNIFTEEFKKPNLSEESSKPNPVWATVTGSFKATKYLLTSSSKFENRMLEKINKFFESSTRIADVTDQGDALATSIEADKAENKIQQVKIDEQMWQNLVDMDKHDNDNDMQQLSYEMADINRGVNSVITMLNVVSKSHSSISSNMTSNA